MRGSVRGTAAAVAERALLHLVGDGANQPVRPVRTVAPPRRASRSEVGSNHVGHEAALGFPTEDGPHDCIRSQVRQHGKADLAVRNEVTGMALDPPRTRAKTDHANDGSTAG